LEAEKQSKGPVKRLNPNQVREQEEIAKQQAHLQSLNDEISYLKEQNQKKEEDITYLKQLKTRTDDIKDLQYQLNYARKTNKNLQDDYDLLNEKYKKDKEMLESMVSELNTEIVAAQTKMKDLQDFFDRHEEIMATERKNNIEMIKDTNKAKDELEAKLRKQLDKTQIELETIKSEFNVKMQKIQL
jgi:chromosome segregation ATPase